MGGFTRPGTRAHFALVFPRGAAPSSPFVGEVERSNFEELVNHLRETWRCYRDWTMPGLHAVALYRVARWRRTLPATTRVLVGCVTKPLFLFVRNVYGIEISEEMQVGRRFVIAHQSGIVISRFTIFGDECLVRQNVTIGVGVVEHMDEGAVIGNRVEIGTGAVILGKVKIGDDVRIGPNTVVTMDVPSKTSVFGNPMRMLPLKQDPKPAEQKPGPAEVA